MKRLALDDNAAIEDYFCHVAPIGVICKHRGTNTLHSAVTAARDKIGQRCNPEYMRQTQQFNPRIERRVEDRERGAVLEMLIEPSRVRKPPKDTYGP